MKHTHITPEQEKESESLLEKITNTETAIEVSAHNTSLIDEKRQQLNKVAA